MISKSWNNILNNYINSDKFIEFYNQILSMYNNKIIYPPKEDIFNCFKLTAYENVKVVIIGQDPYHGVGEAHGLSFSVKDGIKLPPSLKNIYKELYTDLNIPPRESGNLTSWATQGVLLLNSVLTVEKDKAGSHANLGWEEFTDYVVSKLDEREDPVVFVLWGNYARSKRKLIKHNQHLVIESAHPSPLSAYHGFFGSKPFSQINKFLIDNKKEPINW